MNQDIWNEVDRRAQRYANRAIAEIEMAAVQKVYSEHPNIKLAEKAETGTERGILHSEIDRDAERAKQTAVQGDLFDRKFKEGQEIAARELQEELGLVPSTPQAPPAEGTTRYREGAGELRSKSARRF